MGRVAYAAFMLLALGVFLLARRVLPKPHALQRLPWQQRAGLALAAFVGAALGAKLPFALDAPGGPFSGNAWMADGKTVTTGLMGAYLAVELAKLYLGIRVKTGDTFALPLALAMAVGRWGCFFNPCCYGTETTLPWAVPFHLPDGSVLLCRHPTQIYESLFHLTMALVLLELMRRGLLRGHRLQLYLIAYGVYRFLTEFIRPEQRGWLGLTFYQGAALVLVAGLSAQWLIEMHGTRTNADVADSRGEDKSR
jgi:phosphatidylglycerol:prolipoprotein diacylglycerol transferase